MVGFLCKDEHTESAMDLLKGMKHKGNSRNVVTCTTLIYAFSKVRLMDQLHDIYNEMVQEGCCHNLFLSKL